MAPLNPNSMTKYHSGFAQLGHENRDYFSPHSPVLNVLPDCLSAQGKISKFRDILSGVPDGYIEELPTPNFFEIDDGYRLSHDEDNN